MLASIQRGAQRAFTVVEEGFNLVFGARANPLYHLGAISFWLIGLIVVTGFYLYAFYETGVDTTYASVEALTHRQWFAGGVARSVHRYASDALVFCMVLHMVRYFVFGQYRGFRAFSWVSGVVLLWFTYVSGINGFMLPWDRLAQYTATATAEWLDSLPVFRGALVRNFVLAENVTDRFFSLLSFLHIGIPLAMLAAVWVHTQRVPGARVMPPRALTIGVTLAMVLLSLVVPVTSQGPASLDSVPLGVDLDWFYLPLYPLLDRWPPIMLWAALGGATLLLVVLPWIGARRRGGPVRLSFHPAGVDVEARPGETILEAGLRGGLSLPFECRSGGCGVCKAMVIAGSVEHGVVQRSALADADRARGIVLMCRATAGTDLSLEVLGRAPGGAADRPAIWSAQVAALVPLSHDVMQVSLKLEGDARIAFQAGQYLNVLLDDGARRSFSFTTASARTDAIDLHIRRIPGGRFTTHVFERMRVGDPIRFEGPIGEFALEMAGERPIIFIAGSTGFAPVKGLLEEAFERGLTQPLALYWGVRRAHDLYLLPLLEAWVREHRNFRFVPVLSEPAEEDRWSGRTGLVHEALLADFPDLAGQVVYACGSSRMVDAARPAFVAHGLAEDACFSDAFTAVPASPTTVT